MSERFRMGDITGFDDAEVYREPMHRKPRKDHADPTADIAIANVIREQRKEKGKQVHKNDGRRKSVRKMVR